VTVTRAACAVSFSSTAGLRESSASMSSMATTKYSPGNISTFSCGAADEGAAPGCARTSGLAAMTSSFAGGT
jgi:hypothetical protein